jgi:PAS domain S-box-containing protein
MPGRLETLLLAHRADLFAAWEARILESRPRGPAPSHEAVRATVREAYAELLVALHAGEATRPRAPAPRVLALTAIDAGSGRAVAPVPVPGAEAAPADALIALVAGREVIKECAARELAPHDVTECLPELADAFQRALVSRAPQGCQRCLTLQDDQRARVERRLDSVVEHSLDAIVLCDREGVIEAWNRGATELLGRAEGEAIGKSLAVVAPSAEAAAWLAAVLLRAHEHGHVRQSEVALVRPDGARVWADASFTSVRNASGRAIGLWAVFRDITEQRRLIADNLQAERLALIGTMSARFAHEIRNPLSSILLNLDLIRDSLATGARGGDDDEIVGSIAGEVERIQAVVQEYLRFARMPQVRRQPFAFDAALAGHLAMLAPEFKARGVALESSLSAGAGVVLADEDQVWQVVLNLLRNALEATPRGGHVRVESRPLASGVECVVEDDGAGIPLEAQERIFDPFYSTKHSGTGLGLPFVRQVLAEHGTALRLASAPGQGARFSFVLPGVDGH